MANKTLHSKEIKTILTIDAPLVPLSEEGTFLLNYIGDIFTDF
jgi:hypothetical protein